jgi:hypothetical protein
VKAKLLFLIVALLPWSTLAQAGTVLVTAEEAALPPAPQAAAIVLTNRGITRGPRISLLVPEASVSSPFELKVAFRAHGGSKINPDSIKLVYLKSPAVDLTTRVRPFVSRSGLDVIQAEAPPGRHAFKIAVLDSQGREATAVFTISVRK